MMMHLLAAVGDVNAPNDMVSLTALGTFILGVGGMVLTYFKRNEIKGKGAEEERQRSVSIADQPVHVSTEERPQWVTRQTFDEHVQRMEASIEEIKDSLDGERGIARVANGNLHKRLDAMSEKFGDRLSNLEGTSQGVKETVDKLLNIALGKIKPNTRQ